MISRSALRKFAAAARVRTLPALIAGVLACGPNGLSFAAQAPAQTGAGAPNAKPAAAGATRTYTYTLKQLGALYPLQLRGIDGIYGVPFSVRADEVVTGATLRLSYAYSPALLPVPQAPS